MDLMSTMQVEGLGRKWYGFAYVDDFSCYTWLKFIREKSDTNKERKTNLLFIYVVIMGMNSII